MIRMLARRISSRGSVYSTGWNPLSTSFNPIHPKVAHEDHNYVCAEA